MATEKAKRTAALRDKVADALHEERKEQNRRPHRADSRFAMQRRRRPLDGEACEVDCPFLHCPASGDCTGATVPCTCEECRAE